MTPTTITSLLVLIFCWFTSGTARRIFDDDYNDAYFENLGKNIERQVSESLRPLNNLGATITSRVNQDVYESLRPIRRMQTFSGENIGRQVADSLRPLNDLGARISSQVNQDVYEGLRPVREMQSRLKIMFGDGGTTIATYKPSGKRFIVKSGTLYTCSGTISEQDGQCDGSLQRATFNTKTDFCYANVNTIINNWYCIGSGSVNSGAVNGKVFCSGVDGSSTLLISAEEYKNLCAGVADSVTYKYFTNQKLREYGNDVQCSDGTPQVCTTSMSSRYGTSFIHTGGASSVIIN